MDKVNVDTAAAGVALKSLLQYAGVARRSNVSSLEHLRARFRERR